MYVALESGVEDRRKKVNEKSFCVGRFYRLEFKNVILACVTPN